MRNCKKRIAFVVPKYGHEVLSSGEILCAQYVKRLKPYFDIDILTTCAQNDTWTNYYPEGEGIESGLQIKRFLTNYARNNETVMNLTRKLYDNPNHDLKTAAHWLREIGPYSTSMMQYIRDNVGSYDAFLFVDYLFYTTTACMPLVAEKAIFIPVVHDKEVLQKCNYFKFLFQIPKAIVYFSKEERQFIQSLFNNQKNANLIVGWGLEVPAYKAIETDLKLQYELENDPYLVCTGLAEEDSHFEQLICYFRQYKKDHPSGLKLVLVGNKAKKLPKYNDLVYIDYLNENERCELLQSAYSFVTPPGIKDVELLVLESMAAGVPGLVYGNDQALKKHILSGNAGLYYYEQRDFSLALDKLVINRKIADTMGENGIDYISRNYQWKNRIAKLTFLIMGVCEGWTHLADKCKRYEEKN